MTPESSSSAKESAAGRQGDADQTPEQAAARRATMAVVVLALSTLVGCAGAQRAGPQSPRETTQVSAPASPPGPGDLVPDFTVDTLDDGPFSLSAQRGKAMVLFFSAPT